MFHSFNIFDSNEKDRPLKKQFKYEKLDATHGFTLILHDLSISDDILSPFRSYESHRYLTMENSSETPLGDETVESKLSLDNNIVIEQRTRYTIWDLLGDVGGFNDGLMFVCQLLTSTYAAISFKTSFLRQIFYDSNLDTTP